MTICVDQQIEKVCYAVSVLMALVHRQLCQNSNAQTAQILLLRTVYIVIFLLSELVPVTVFYSIILILQVNLTSAPMATSDAFTLATTSILSIIIYNQTESSSHHVYYQTAFHTSYVVAGRLHYSQSIQGKTQSTA